MSVYPVYVSSQKKYEKLYRSIRYKDKDIVELLSMFNISMDKLSSAELYFRDKIDLDIIDYILKCILLDVKGIYSESIKENCLVISNMERPDLTRSFQFFIPKCKKYSLIDLVNLICTFKPKELSEKEILNMISECPENKVLSLDLMLYVSKRAPYKYSSSLGVISNDELIFEYIHNVLFSRDSSYLSIKKRDNYYLCIDTGKDVPESKIKDYKIVNRDHHLVSNSEETIMYTVKILSRGKKEDNLDPSDFLDIVDKEEKVKPKRKAIPKAIRNQLWKKHFGDNIKGVCYCCKSEIDALTHFEAGHIIASAKGGTDSVDNLRPVCMSCNRSMGTMNMDEYIKKYIKP